MNNFASKSSKKKSKKSKDAQKTCNFCKSPNHLRKDCAGFRGWLEKKGDDVVSFIDESFLVNFPLILGGLIQVRLCTSLIHYRYSIQ